MAKHVYTTRDKSDWGDGPWQHEPDKVQWTDSATGLPCLVLRGPLGSWCGYVGVPPGHRYHGFDYDDVGVDVHGGLTFADSCHEDGDEATSICHIPEPGEPDNVWWLGFDCAHFMDYVPVMAVREREMGFKIQEPKKNYRDLAWVRQETERLATQVAE